MGGHVVALCGGVGGAKLAHGLSLVLRPQDLTIVVNTGDDFKHLGLHISPDLDSVMYALSGWSDPVRGWGRRDETWTFMGAMEKLGGESWFRLGDGDLATHVERTRRLSEGSSLTAVTDLLCKALGIGHPVLPMSDDPVRTRVLTENGWLDFQEYFVRQQCQPRVRDFMFAGVDTAKPQPQLMEALGRSDLRGVIICPSNPFVSIEPILSIDGIRSAIQRVSAPVVAVTPIIGGKAIKGPAAKMLTELGLDASATGVARRYLGVIDGLVLDKVDESAEPVPGIEFFTAPTLMNIVEDRVALAREVLRIVDNSTSTDRGGSRHGSS